MLGFFILKKPVCSFFLKVSANIGVRLASVPAEVTHLHQFREAISKVGAQQRDIQGLSAPPPTVI